jgi:hypothetical protein
LYTFAVHRSHLEKTNSKGVVGLMSRITTVMIFFNILLV